MQKSETQTHANKWLNVLIIATITQLVCQKRLGKVLVKGSLMVRMNIETLLAAAISMFSRALLKPLRFGSHFLEETAGKVCQRELIGGKFGRALTKKGLTRARHLQQNLQQQGTVTLRLRYGCGTVAIISL